MKRSVALIVAVVFGIGTAGLALAQTTASPAPAQTPAPATAPAAPAPAQKPAESKQKPMEAKKPKHAQGVVKSASPDSLVVAGKEKGSGKEMKDAEWTFAVDSKTAIRKSGKAITAADLKPGDSVQVKYMDHAGKATAMTVQVKGTTTAAKPAEKK